jgi:hypothetical protein
MTLAVAAALLFAVSPALASQDLESEFAEMKELVKGLQQKVEAQEEQLEHQGELLEDAQSAVKATQEQTESLSGLSSFLDSIEVVGHVAGSYNYNFNTPRQQTFVSQESFPVGDGDIGGAGLNSGAFGALPFHQDHNTFSVDQIWFGIGKPATEESPAGFQVDFLYGENANHLGQGTGYLTDVFSNDLRLTSVNRRDESFPLGRRYTANDSTSDFYVAQAYIEYECGCIGEGTNLKFGKFQTPVGAEVVQATGNYNITRGIVYSMLQPVDHLGLIGTTDLGPIELGAGIVNSGGSDISSPDLNKEKSYIATAAVGDDRMSLRTTFVFGGEEIARQDRQTGLVDVTAWFNPADNVSMWANYNYLYLEETGTYANGVALAGRVGLTDKIGAALRGEYIKFNDNDDPNAEFYTLTGTIDYSLTDHLTAKAEVRYDYVNENEMDFAAFATNREVSGGGSSGDRGMRSNQTVGLVEVVYEF